MLSSGYVSNYNFSVETMAIAEGFEAYQDEAETMKQQEKMVVLVVV